MDTISSAEFRKTYGKLTRATVVTANGHVIGEWRPIPTGFVQANDLSVAEADSMRQDFERNPDRYDIRPIRPVTKHR